MNTLGSLDAWIGRRESASDQIAPVPCAALAATLDLEPRLPAAGTPLPPLWHWLYFLPLHRRSELGVDGHAKRGGFLPPVPLPRRMWAGGRLSFQRPLAIGAWATRVSTIERVEAKTGRSGGLVFVTIRHEIACGRETGAALIEHQDIVYRDAARPGERSASNRRAPPQPAWQQQWLPDDVTLFRYSALTFNGHRIHYDRRYASQAEGYPGLVVHGPLIATLLVELLRRQRPDARIAAFEFRAVAPIFDTGPFSLCGAPRADGKRFDLWAQDPEGSLAMDAIATIE